MSDQPAKLRPQTHFILLFVVGIVSIAATLAVTGWVTGYLKPKEKIAMITWNQDPYWDMVIRGAQDAAKEWNVDLTVIRSKPDEKEQTQHIRDMLDLGMQAIAISPNNSTAQLPILKEVADKMPLVTFDSDADVPNRKGFIGTDNYIAGWQCAEQVRNAIPDGGEVIMSVGSVDMFNGQQRRQGVIDNLLDRRSHSERPSDPIDAALKGSHYSIAATILDGGDSEQTVSRVADAIKSHPNVKCIVGLFSYSAPAIVKAIEQSGKKGQIKVIGFDESDETQAGVEAGSIYSSILQDQYRSGSETVDLMVESLRHINQGGPTRVRITHLRIWVMKPDNIADLRTDKMIHQPGTATP